MSYTGGRRAWRRDATVPPPATSAPPPPPPPGGRGGDLRRRDEMEPELAQITDLMAAAVRVAAAGDPVRGCDSTFPARYVTVPVEAYDMLLDACEAVEPGIVKRIRDSWRERAHAAGAGELSYRPGVPS